MAVFSLALLLLANLVGASPEIDGALSVIKGTGLDPGELEALEERLDRNPHDSTARMQLLGYHSMKQWTDPASARRHGELVLWLIRNDPRNPVLAMPYGHVDPHLSPQVYAQARDAWLEQTEQGPEDVVLLGNAAALVSSPGARSDHHLAVALLNRAEAVDPDNAEWPFKLGQLYWMEGAGLPDAAAAVNALPYFERAYRLAGGAHGPHSALALVALMRAAFTAGKADDARAYALEILDSENPLLRDGDARHRANVTLGRVALAEGGPRGGGQVPAGRRPGGWFAPRSRRSVRTCAWRRNCLSWANERSCWSTSNSAGRFGRRLDWTSGQIRSARAKCRSSAATCSTEGSHDNATARSRERVFGGVAQALGTLARLAVARCEESWRPVAVAPPVGVPSRPVFRTRSSRMRRIGSGKGHARLHPAGALWWCWSCSAC